MTDLDQVLPLWQQLHEARAEYVLATVVRVDGSGYRKPGARMLVAADGRRAGTVSGGCLEAEVARKAFWHTENGPVVRRYSTNPDDGDVPFGMGCGGVIHLLLERSSTAAPVMERLARSFADREPITVATVLEGTQIGRRAYWPPDESGDDEGGDFEPEDAASGLAELAYRGYAERRSFTEDLRLPTGEAAQVFVEWKVARPGLFVFGAGDDVVPVVRLGRQMGWFVAVLDGRSHLATRARFPDANAVHVLGPGQFPELLLRAGDAAAVMTHSLEQDTRALNALLGEELAYIGVLGPRQRTEQMLTTIAEGRLLSNAEVDAQVEAWMERLHAPMGLELGGNTSTAIALAVVAEIQRHLHQASGLPLREIRARSAPMRISA